MRIAPTAAGIEAWLAAAPNAERHGDYRALRPERMRAFLARLPPPPAPCTVAGTKGKGSTTLFIAAALVAHGIPTTAFYSPHVRSVLERWQVDGRNADPQTIARLAERVDEEERASGLRLSWFERTFAIACLLAAERGGAFVCEVGIGGRLDATNALDAAVAVLTHISHDHRETLGPTLWHIAGEKLAISRPGRPLVIAPQSPAATLAIWHRLPPGRSVHWAVPGPDIPLAMRGAHQRENLGAALLAARLYRPGIDHARALSAIASAALPARGQRVGRVLVDGAHNGPSLAAALAVAAQEFPDGFTLVFGTGRDKEIDEMLAVIPGQLRVVRCGYSSPRARGPGDWPEAARRWPWYQTVRAALAALPGPLLIAGSFYLAGEALAALGEQAEEDDLAAQRGARVVQQ
ncbi:MAG: hypothetical protein RMM29_02420 [Planctomycetota bacterium]|nr:hypothetical protein [Planctomycetota bacterium]MCX8040212.1 hypothetical protein [Planctomycetota bacterium]MDW8372493.1 hypothetical protein [Planctomycetota bacterium]